MGGCLSVEHHPAPAPSYSHPTIYYGPTPGPAAPSNIVPYPTAASTYYHTVSPVVAYYRPDPRPPMSGLPWEQPAALVDPALAGAPRYFLGSAWHQATWDLAHKQEEWPSVRTVVGYHNHPCGWHGHAQAKGYGGTLLGAFQHKYFTLEADLHDTCACSLRDNPVTFGENLVQTGPEWRCMAFMPNVSAGRLANDTGNQAALYREVFDKARAKGYTQNYILFAPPSPSARDNYAALMGGTRDGLPLWIWVARECGAVGVAIDHPAQHWQNCPELRSLGLKVGQDCQLYGLKFIWVLNGTGSRAQTAALAEDVRRSGVRVDYWIVDQFDQQAYPGTPEWGESAAGQMKVLIDGRY